VLWHCWLGHLTRKNRPWYDLYVFGGTLNPTLLLMSRPVYVALPVTALIDSLTLTFDLLTSKSVHGFPVWWTSTLPALGFLCLSILELGQGTQQTDTTFLMPTPYGGRGHNKHAIQGSMYVYFIFLFKCESVCRTIGGLCLYLWTSRCYTNVLLLLLLLLS